MYFLDEQIIEFDKKMLAAKKPLEQSLFVHDEVSAIQWLKQRFSEKTHTSAEIHPKFMQELGGMEQKRNSTGTFDPAGTKLYPGRFRQMACAGHGKRRPCRKNPRKSPAQGI
jgi:hypothetical protein